MQEKPGGSWLLFFGLLGSAALSRLLLESELVFSILNEDHVMQLSLWDQLGPRPDFSFSSSDRIDLGEGAWLDYAPEWMTGHHQLLDLLIESATWERHRREMYDRIVEVPRLVAGMPGASGFSFRDGEVERIPCRASTERIDEARRVLGGLAAGLSARYRRNLSQVSLGYYRNGSDSVAYHGDKLGPLRKDTVVAIVSVGARRKFLLRPSQEQSAQLERRPRQEKTAHLKRGPGREKMAGEGRTIRADRRARTLSFQVGAGDLLVMGGNCQLSWEHAVPKVAHAEPRIAIMFREILPEMASTRPATSRRRSSGWPAVSGS